MSLLPSQMPYGPAAFQDVHDFVMNQPTFVGSTAGDNFMEKFAEHTIRGAELDSSERDPPPRCHPGTRKGIVDYIQLWFRNPDRTKRMLWLVGPAGVGKSAIMQTVAEQQSQSTILAALFFSAPNGRNDPFKAITTLAYQIALQHLPYQHHIREKITANPTIWNKSIVKQFDHFFVEPFVKRGMYHGSPILIFIDGLDECKGQREQIIFLSLIAYFTNKYPNAPLLWVISSRPEAHITTHLARRKLAPCFDQQEVPIDSLEACQDVERYLRAEFAKIQASEPYISSLPCWPSEDMFLTIAAAAGGLFAYAMTIVHFIGDTSYGDPISKLQVVVDLIRQTSQSIASATSARPMAQLDALYQYILSQIATEDMSHAQEVLAYTSFNLTSGKVLHEYSHRGMLFMCDWMGMAPNVAYAALRQLHSVVQVPLPREVDKTSVKIRHKSFSDFLLNPNRSGMSFGTEDDAELRDNLRALRILKNIPYSTQPTTPDRPAHGHIVLSWLSGQSDAQELGYRRAQLHSIASRLLSVCWKQVAQHPDFCHALRVMNIIHTSDDLRMLLLGEAPQLARQLKNDGSLLDIPASMIDLTVLGKQRLIVPYYGCFFIGFNSAPKEYEVKFFALFEYATKHPMGNFFVTGFIGNHLKGWIQCCCTVPTKHFPHPETYFATYDFSTIYDRLEGGCMRESLTTSS